MCRCRLIIGALLALPWWFSWAEAPIRVKALGVSQTALRDGVRGLIYTDSTLRISRVLVGAAGDLASGRSIVVRQLGGHVGGERLTVIGAPLMRPGQRCTATLLPARGEPFFHPLELLCTGPAAGRQPASPCEAGTRERPHRREGTQDDRD